MLLEQFKANLTSSFMPIPRIPVVSVHIHQSRSDHFTYFSVSFSQPFRKKL